jgi:hypothetical protein
MDAYASWERNTQPEGSAEDCWRLGLRVLYGNGDPSLARELIEQSLPIIDRIHREDRLASEGCRLHWPRNKASLLRTEVFVQGLLGGEPDLSALVTASDILAQDPGAASQSKWDSHDEYQWLSAIRLALIAGDLARSAALLSRTESFETAVHAEQATMLEVLVVSASGDLPISDLGVRERFTCVFDVYRPPYPSIQSEVYYDADITRFELALIGDRYIVGRDGRIDFERAVRSVPGADTPSTEPPRSGSRRATR